MPNSTDTEFVAQLRSHLAQFKDGHKPVVPLVRNLDGSINRAETLALPCYENFSESEQ